MSFSQAAPVVDNWTIIHESFFIGREINLASDVINVKAPIQAEDASIVPFSFEVNLRQSHIKRIDVFTDANPILLTGTFLPQQLSSVFKVSTRIRLENNSMVRVVVEDTDGRLFAQSVPIKTPGGGCGGGLNSDETKLRVDAGKVKVKRHAQLNEIAVYMQHPMRTGFERTPQGYYAKAWFMKHLRFELDGQSWLHVNLAPGISANPYFNFHLPDSTLKQTSQQLSIQSQDNEGAVFEFSTVLE